MTLLRITYIEETSSFSGAYQTADWLWSFCYETQMLLTFENRTFLKLTSLLAPSQFLPRWPRITVCKHSYCKMKKTILCFDLPSNG